MDENRRALLTEEEEHKVFGRRTGVSKIEAHGWKVADGPGEFAMISKFQLFVDPTYQRTEISTTSVTRIAKEWSWLCLGAITVVKRTDGFYYVVDGQHRTLAALKRSDVDELPCMIFRGRNESQEADGFVKSNLNRTSVTAHERFKARLVANDPRAIKLEAIVKKYGLEITSKPSNGYGLRCINVLDKLIRKGDGSDIDATFNALSKLEDFGKTVITFEVVQAIAYIHNHFDKAFDSEVQLKRIRRYSIAHIQRVISRHQDANQKKGEKIGAEALASLLNRGAKKDRIVITFS